MAHLLQEITLNKPNKSRKRLGRGIGSGKGKTAGRGHKGQKSRTGVAIKSEGGQQPLIKRLPKRGFNPLSRTSYQIVTLQQLQLLVDTKKVTKESKLTREKLVELGLISNILKPIKLLSNGQINTPLSIQVDKISKNALSKLSEAGGSVI